MDSRFENATFPPVRARIAGAVIGAITLTSGSAWAGGGGGVNLDLDFTFVIQLAIVLATWMMLKALVFGPYLKAVEARAAKTSDTRSEAEALEQRAAELEARYQSGITDARARAAGERQALRVDGLGQKDATVAEARAETTAKLGQARTDIATQVETARTALLGNVGDISTLVVEKILGRGA